MIVSLNCKSEIFKRVILLRKLQNLPNGFTGSCQIGQKCFCTRCRKPGAGGERWVAKYVAGVLHGQRLGSQFYLCVRIGQHCGIDPDLTQDHLEWHRYGGLFGIDPAKMFQTIGANAWHVCCSLRLRGCIRVSS